MSMNPVNVPRRIAKKLLLIQLVIVLIVAVAGYCLWSWQVAAAVGAGGLSSILPNLLFARGFFKTAAPQEAKQIIARFMFGELFKLLLIGVILALSLVVFGSYIVWVFIGFGAAYLAFWVAPLFI